MLILELQMERWYKMSIKTNVSFTIGNKVYTVNGYESEAYLQKVASYIQQKTSKCEELPEYRLLSSDMRIILLELNIADDYFKAKSQIEHLEEDLERRNQEVYQLKHELVALQIKMDSLNRTIEEVEKKNRLLTLKQMKLEDQQKDAQKPDSGNS